MTVTSVALHLAWVVPAVGLIGAAGYYLGEKDLAQISSRLKAYEDAGKLPLAEVVEDAKAVIRDLRERQQLERELETALTRLKAIEGELKRKTEFGEVQQAEIASKEKLVKELQFRQLPNATDDDFDIKGNQQVRLPVTGELLGLVYAGDIQLDISINGNRVNLRKGEHYQTSVGDIVCVLTPINWGCCSSWARFNYKCKNVSADSTRSPG